MTTINNSENLIEKVGGIEKAREIVEGTPVECAYYGLVNNIVIYYQWSEEWFWHNSNTNEYERDFSKSMKFSLNDLRTAIAKHDSREFKVGDLVVGISYDDFDDEILRIVSLFNHFGVASFNYEASTTYGDEEVKLVRHATPKEIKAGHRIDDTTDHVTDKVIEI